MQGIEIFSEHRWILSPWIHLNSDTMIYTWISLAILLLCTIACRWCLSAKPRSLASYLIKRFIHLFMDQTTAAYGSLNESIVSFFVTLALFIFICNALVLIPYLEEPTKDLNSTLAFSISSFLFIQYQGLRAHGIFEYIQEYFKMPIPVRSVYPTWSLSALIGIPVRCVLNFIIGCALLPIELLGKLSPVLSLSFRLFGNILAGSVIALLWLNLRSSSLTWQIIGLASGFNILIALFFGLFEALIQAGVFTMLSISYLSRMIHREH